MKQAISDIVKEKIMGTIAQNEVLAKIAVAQLEAEIETFLEPVTKRLPEKRLRKVVHLAIRGISGAQAPVVTQMARCLESTQQGVWAMSKRLYGLLGNKRLSHRTLLKGLYALAQQQVAQEAAETLVVAIDPVNFEKPYTHQLEGVSTVMKSTPPALDGEKRLTHGYRAITATIVNLTVEADHLRQLVLLHAGLCEPELFDRANHPYHPHPLSALAGTSGRG
jgi:hypothetical protein